MKTSELKRVLWEDCVESWSETDNVIYNMFWTVWKKERRIIVNGLVPISVLKVLGEYNNTPPSEREDEKKYRIMMENTFPQVFNYLTLIVNQKTYYLSASKNNTEEYQRIFTQQEINNFPQKFKGAVECGFLKKVEVEGE